ncbi:MAG: hypothetical protein ACRDHV_02165 [Actinomycetota bacterium]
MPRVRHPKKEVEEALKGAEEQDWTVRSSKSGHRWGVAECGAGCSVSIWSTPKNAGNHGKDIRRAVGRCPHGEEGEDDG